MGRLLLLDVVGLTPALLGEHTPNLSRLATAGAVRPLGAITPAVTCSAQSTLLTGALPSEHGIVGNGWYFRDLAQVWLWRQSNHLVGGEKLWDAARKHSPDFTCAQLFWWYNMYADVDWSVTPRPQYLADGRKAPDIYSAPAELRDSLQAQLGPFPLFNFWGPNANITSSRWIGDCALRVMEQHSPTLTMVYLPHLDYCLQKFGPASPRIADELRAVDAVAGDLIEQAQRDGQDVVVCSEYGITEVSGPIHINRALREAGLIAVRQERGTELLDPGASQAFAVSDHQIAHVYVKDPARISEVHALLEKLDGVETVASGAQRASLGLDHPRSGEVVAVSAADRWFTYYYWLDDARAPDFARCVDIHNKPGYDPVEMFLDPSIRLPLLAVGSRLAKKALGFRMTMDVIPLDASLVKGSHGRPTDNPQEGPILITSRPDLLQGDEPVPALDFKQLMLQHLLG